MSSDHFSAQINRLRRTTQELVAEYNSDGSIENHFRRIHEAVGNSACMGVFYESRKRIVMPFESNTGVMVKSPTIVNPSSIPGFLIGTYINHLDLSSKLDDDIAAIVNAQTALPDDSTPQIHAEYLTAIGRTQFRNPITLIDPTHFKESAHVPLTYNPLDEYVRRVKDDLYSNSYYLSAEVTNLYAGMGLARLAFLAYMQKINDQLDKMY